MQVGDRVRILVGPYRGEIAMITAIERDAGARNGWYTVKLSSTTSLLYAGEEIAWVK